MVATSASAGTMRTSCVDISPVSVPKRFSAPMTCWRSRMGTRAPTGEDLPLPRRPVAADEDPVDPFRDQVLVAAAP